MLTIVVYFLLFFQILLVVCMFLISYWLIRGIYGVPWIRSKRIFSKAMLDLANVRHGETVVDFGCGDGSILIHAAKEYGANGIGYEYLWMIVILGRIKALLAFVTPHVKIFHKNFLNEDILPKADVIFSYLYPEVNEQLEPLLKRDYPSGTRVVSRTFLFPTLPLKEKRQVGREWVYLYEIP